jgi:hypothetical protein
MEQRSTEAAMAIGETKRDPNGIQGHNETDLLTGSYALQYDDINCGSVAVKYSISSECLCESYEAWPAPARYTQSRTFNIATRC